MERHNCIEKEYSLDKSITLIYVTYILGSLINCVAYFSLEPLIVNGFLFLSSIFILMIFKWSGRSELKIFSITFSICWFWAGIAALYANYGGDLSQLNFDAADFYRESISNNGIENMNIIQKLNSIENSLPILIWKFFYNLFYHFGFEKGRYIGITINILFVALTSVFCVKIIRKIFVLHQSRIRTFTFIYPLCGIFWLFAALHVRDASVLFANTVLVYFWIKFLFQQNFVNLFKLIIATVISLVLFVFLRREFLFVPLVMIGIGIISIFFEKSKKNKINFRFFIILFIFIIIAVIIFFINWKEISDTLMYGRDSYNEMAIIQSGNSSLGNRFITNQPLPIRLIIGSIYLLIFPIPFWTGFQFDSAYLLFKSLHTIFMYGFLPVLIVALFQFIKKPEFRTAPLLFLFLSFLTFTLGIAETSLETRHLGAFIPILLIFSSIVDLSSKEDRVYVRRVLYKFILFISVIHIGWVIMKFI